MYDVARIEKPKYFGIRHTIRGRGKRIPFVIGFDTEADDSRPFLMQMSEQGTPEQDTLVFNVSKKDDAGLSVFMEYVCARLLGRFGRKHEVIIYGWNLPYEWTQLWHDRVAVAQEDELQIEMTFDYYGKDHHFTWTVYNDKRVFAKLYHETSHLTIRILDGMMFYKTGLDAAAKMLGLGAKYEAENNVCTTPGLWHSSGHSRSEIDRSLATDAEFLLYARRDAYITRLVGEQIIELHEAYDITQCISAPHFASSVFKRQFLTQEVLLPPEDLEQAGLWSYHGGKNGFYLDGPTHFDSIYQYDITSAYPEAMRQLPNIETANWIRVNTYTRGRHAIYKVTLRYNRCRWRGMLAHDGKWPESGYLEDICITSYELDAMIDHNEITIITCAGWEMVGKSGGPLERFVDVFFSQKARSVGVERETAKLLLNSLYGKFFQKVSLGTVGYYDFDNDTIVEHNIDGPFDWKAGGLYHPPIASLITGYVRGKIHRLEHKYQSVMTSTDGMFALQPPDPTDLGKHLGGLTCEQGTLDIWRERLYVFRSPALEKPKAAFHGWWSNLKALEALPLAHGTYEYQSEHMVTLKESLKMFDKRYYEPGSFIIVKRQITI